MSIVNSIRSQLVPIHREGYPFVGTFALASLILFLLWSPLGWIGTVLTLWCALFFRDPVRVTPVREGIVVAPADGRIATVGNAMPPKELGLGERPLPRVSIFMSVFNCHVNRSPVAGRIEEIVYHAGSFLSADLDKASEENERNSFVISAAGARIGVVQIAGLVARRIVCFVRKGATLWGRRAHRHDPLRLARRCLSARGCPRAGGRGPDRGRRRDRHRRPARRRPRPHLPGGLESHLSGGWPSILARLVLKKINAGYAGRVHNDRCAQSKRTSSRSWPRPVSSGPTRRATRTMKRGGMPPPWSD